MSIWTFSGLATHVVACVGAALAAVALVQVRDLGRDQGRMRAALRRFLDAVHAPMFHLKARIDVLARRADVTERRLDALERRFGDSCACGFNLPDDLEFTPQEPGGN